MRSTGKWTAVESVPELGKAKCDGASGLLAQNDARLSPSEYGKPRLAPGERAL
jgi:hypothetical protein